jgi:uncharacterized repeat protein (TIGR01451 family)
LALGLLPAAAEAATVTVDILGDEDDPTCALADCALREAIAVANPGDTIAFAPLIDGGSITLSLGQLVIAKNLTIDGGGPLGITVRAGSPRLFKIQGASTVVALSNLTLRDSPANSPAEKHGGALYNEGQLTLTDVVFRANRSYGVTDIGTSADGGDGGAIYNAAGASLSLVRVVLRDSGTGKGGFFAGGANYHGGRGGAVYNAGALHLVDCTIRDSFTGGGTCAQSDGGDGGAIYNAGTATVTGSTLETSATGDGGSQDQAGCPPFGGAGFDGRGGAIFNAGQLAINDSTLTGNTTATDTSGIAAPGGGLYNAPDGTARLRNATIAENTAAGASGGGIYRAAGTAGHNSNLLVKNSLIAKNVALAGANEDCGNVAGNGALTSESFNLVGVADGCAGVFGINDQVGSAALPLDPLLNALALNGGPTDTYLPQPTSPAIDEANPDNAQCDAWDAGTATSTPFTVDQRGQPRPVDGDGAVGARCDVGSVEAPQPATADLAVTKTDGLANAVPGGQLTYTIVVTNNGPDPAPGTLVEDLFANSLTCSWTCVPAGGATCTAGPVLDDIADTIDLPAAASATYAAVCTLAGNATGTLTNTATVGLPGLIDPVPGNNNATDVDTVGPEVDLALTKSDGAANEVPGTTVTYTIVASNDSGGNVTGAIVADSFPAAITGVTWTCGATGAGSSCPLSGSGNLNQTVNIGAGGNVTFSATGTIAAGATGTLTNTATVAVPAGTVDPVPANNTATDIDTLVPTADLAISKTDGAANEVPGTSVTYTIVASNPAGGSHVIGATVADTFPGSITGVTWTCAATGTGSSCPASGSGNLNQTVNIGTGGNVTFNATGTIDPGATGTLANTATLTAPGGFTDPNGTNNTDTDTDTLVPTGNLAISKTDGAANEVPGTAVTYTIVASNPAGGSLSAGATVVDSFPASITGVTWSCVPAGVGTLCTANGVGDLNQSVDIGPGGSVTFTASGTIAPEATGSLANTATLTAPAGFTDPSSANNTATDTDTLAPTADLAVTKTDGAVSEVPGTTVTYTIVASNLAGPSTAVGATVVDTFPASVSAVGWTCVASGVGSSCPANGNGNLNQTVDIGAGGNVTFTATGTIAASALGSLTNTATVNAPAGFTDPAGANNAATDTDVLLADFGDAPDPGYPTLLASNGARHAPGSGLALGAAVDWEADGQPAVGATGDGSDDDGVVQQNGLERGRATDFTVTATQAGRLSAWFDWNADGDWNDVGEQTVSDQLLAAGTNTVTVSVPANATVGLSHARFRLATATGLAATGAASDGEVEDYQVRVGPHADGFETGNTGRWDATVGN